MPIIREYSARTEAVPTVELRARVRECSTRCSSRKPLGHARPDPVRDPARGVRGRLDRRGPTLQGRGRPHAGARRVDRRSHAAQLEQRSRSREGAAGREPLPAARRGPRDPAAGPGHGPRPGQVAAAGVDAAAAALKDSELAQRTRVQLAEAAVQSAKAALTQAELNLGYTTVRSPIDGIAGKVQVDRGNLVARASPRCWPRSHRGPDLRRLPDRGGRLPQAGCAVKLDDASRAPESRPALDLVLADGKVFPHRGRVTFVDARSTPRPAPWPCAPVPESRPVLRPGHSRGCADHRGRPNAVLVPQRAVQEQQGNRSCWSGCRGHGRAEAVKLDERVEDFYSSPPGWPRRAGHRGRRAEARPGQPVKAELQRAGASRAEFFSRARSWPS